MFCEQNVVRGGVLTTTGVDVLASPVHGIQDLSIRPGEVFSAHLNTGIAVDLPVKVEVVTSDMGT